MAPSSDYFLECVLCKKTYSEEQTVTRCLKCKGALDVRYRNPLPKKTAGQFIKDPLFLKPLDLLKKLNRLPMKSEHFVSLGECNTPLLKSRFLREQFGLSNLYLKYEGANPTGVFKDRGSAVEISKAVEMGAKAVVCASTGNMAASVAAYCAKAKLPCYVLIPENTPLGKLAQAIAYGARALKIRGTYADCVKLSEAMAKHYNFYLAGDYAFRLEGQKTIAYELIGQLEGKASDVVIVPIGCGTNMAGIYKGFCELLEMGVIKKIPRFIGVQPEGVPTVVAAWRKKQNHYVPVEQPRSVASAVAIGHPLDDVKVLKALYDSNGYGETASEQEIKAAHKLLGKSEALFVEPSAALPVAVLQKLIGQKIISKKDTIVAVITGSGLKDPQAIFSTGVTSPVIEPLMSEVDRYFSVGLDRVNGNGRPADKDKELWKKAPSMEELKSALKKMFKIKLDNSSLKTLYDILRSFDKKEKTIRQGDLQYALENILKMPAGMERALVIEDFSVHVTEHLPAEAWVLLSFQGQSLAHRAKGVGPVDAIITAIRDAIKTRDQTRARLTHYNVEINTAGTDAVVVVHLTVADQDGYEVTGEAASPDVIVASIKAFENAYNLLAWKYSARKNHAKIS